MTTLTILMIAYRIGLSLTLNHAKGIITKASNNKIQITSFMY